MSVLSRCVARVANFGRASGKKFGGATDHSFVIGKTKWTLKTDSISATKGESAGGKEEQKSHLPRISQDDPDKFNPGMVGAWFVGIEARMRCLDSSLSRFWEPRTLPLLCLTLVGVYSLGALEAVFTLLPSVPVSAHSTYILQYANENFLPSFTLSTTPAPIIAGSLGLNVDAIINPYLLPVAQMYPPYNDFPVTNGYLTHVMLSKARHLLGGVFAFTQLVRVVTLSAAGWREYYQGVLGGTEPLLRNGTSECVIRLCGWNSDCTAVSIERYGSHIIPVWFQKEFALSIYGKNLKEPVWWHVSPDDIDRRASWKMLNISPRLFLKTSTGRQVLYLEADATVSEECLALGGGNILSVDNVVKAFRCIGSAAEERNRGFRVFRVLLTNSNDPHLPPGFFQALRRRIALRKEADVVIDGISPILQEIIQWAKRMMSQRKDDDNRIALDTNRDSYYRFLKVAFQIYGVELVRSSTYDTDKQLKHHQSDQEEDPLPCLIYYATTSDTVQATLSGITAKFFRPDVVCVVLEKKDGLDELLQYEQRFTTNTVFVCSAKIYDDLFSMVRKWMRMGFNAADIQAELDRRNKEMVDVIARIGSIRQEK